MIKGNVKIDRKNLISILQSCLVLILVILVALLPGQYQPDALRRVLNRLTAKLLKKRRYDAIININTLLYCAAKAVGAR